MKCREFYGYDAFVQMISEGDLRGIKMDATGVAIIVAERPTTAAACESTALSFSWHAVVFCLVGT
jgi:hypothetical protein